jgi:hypothetical protein
MILCPYCRQPNREDARFCGSCGRSLVDAPIEQPRQPTWQPPPAQPPGTDYLALGASGIAVLACVFFVILCSLTVPAYFLSSRITDAELYIDALQEADVYADFPALFAEQMDYWINGLKSSYFLVEIFFQNLARADWEIIAERIITTEWLQAQTESLIQQFFDYGDAREAGLALKISFSELKERLGGETGFQTYMDITSTKPECNILELTQWLVAPFIDLLPICKLPEGEQIFLFSAPDPKKVVPEILADWANTLPDEDDLAESFSQADLDEIDSLFSLMKIVQIGSLVGMFLAVLLLALSLVSPSVRSSNGWLLYWGMSLFFAGFFVLSFAILFTLVAIWQIGELFQSMNDIFIASAVDLGVEVGTNITISLALPIGIVGLILVVLGAGMTAASFLTRASRSRY